MKFGGDDIDRMLEEGTNSAFNHRGGPPPRYGGRGGRGGYNAVPPPPMNHGRGYPRDDGPPRYGRRDDRGGPHDRRNRSRSRDRGGYGGYGGRGRGGRGGGGGGGGGRGGYKNDIEYYGMRRQRTSQSPSRYGYDDDRRLSDDQAGIDRDSRTVFACQIHPKCDERDIFEFFSAVGKVVDVQLIRDNRTFKSKGLCYVEFEEKSSVAQALSLSGQSLAGFPVSVQLTQAEKNRAAQQAAQVAQQVRPMKLYVSNIHIKVTEEDIRPVFSAFGEILSLEIKTDHRHKSKGYGFVEFKKEVDAMGAMQQLNDLEILGQKIKVAAADQPSDGASIPMMGASAPNGNRNDGNDGRGSNYHSGGSTKISDEVGNGGLSLSTADKLNLMAKLGRGQVKPAPHPNLNTSSSTGVMEKGRGHHSRGSGGGYNNGHHGGLPSHIQTPQQYSSFNNNSRSRCVLLSNMFNPATESDPDFDMEIREDVREEVGKFGKVLHIYVDKTNAAGLVYLKFNLMDEAQRSIEALNGRWFAKQQIKATYYEEKVYNKQFNL